MKFFHISVILFLLQSLTWSRSTQGRIIEDDEYEDYGDEESQEALPPERPTTFSNLVFSPAKLSFINAPALLPTVSEFTITNLNEEEINIISVVSNSTQFHPVMFQSQILQPSRSLTMQLMFLPYYVETIDSILTVFTSMGNHHYNLKGSAVANPYRLHAFLGHRIPAGVQNYNQPIVIFNPHADPLQIREIFTTEQFLSLQSSFPPPSDSSTDSGSASSPTSSSSLSIDNGSNNWIVQPGQELEVIMLSMVAKLPGRYQGYVHIVTDRDKIVLPVELIVLEGGLYPRPEILDFGILTQVAEKRELNLWLLNAGASDIR